jgi:nucleotide-binding universal stress UspA family protein
MGTRSRAALGSLFVESVAQQVLHLSEMPVPLVR